MRKVRIEGDSTSMMQDLMPTTSPFTANVASRELFRAVAASEPGCLSTTAELRRAARPVGESAQ
jgi:hypothetical protein